jgi:endonuclease/exonuclease/phosphatase (EEP) superfamily protein YafD
MVISRLARRAAPVAVGAAAATVLVPDVLGLDGRLPMLAAVAWRPKAVVAAAVGATVAATWPPARPAAAAAWGVVVGAGVAALRARMRRPAVHAPSADPDGGAPVDLTILSLNVFNGRADTGVLAALIAREAPDLVVLPEAGCDFRDKLTPLVAGLGYRGWAATRPGVPDIMGVAVLAGPRAGDLQVRSGTELHYRHLHVRGGILGGRELVAVHTTAPRNRHLAAQWRRDLAHVGRWTRAEPTPLVVGDLNATVDNAPLRAAFGGCVPASTGVDGLVGTFPAALPRWFGIQIDHVLVPAGTVTVRFAVHDVAGTDHRGVVARVRLPVA